MNGPLFDLHEVPGYFFGERVEPTFRLADAALTGNHCMLTASHLWMLITCRGMAAGAAVCILIAGILMAQPAAGQFSASHIPETLPRGEPANVFFSWAGSATVDGFVVELPPDWDLENVSVLKNPYRSIPLRLQTLSEGRYDVSLASPLDAESELIIRLRGGDDGGTDQIIITPYAVSTLAERREMLGADRYPVEIRSDPVSSDPENRVLSFADAEARPLVFRQESVPAMDLHLGFYVSFWMKSTDLNQVVWSTWDGANHHAYPVELVVDPAGRLRSFRGRPGEHQSMGSKRPIADGAWHHVVVRNEPDAGWMRLQIDGETVDSLFSATPPHIAMELPLAVGGRVPGTGTESYFDGTTPYSGYVDAVEIQHIEADAAAASLELDFDGQLPEDLLVDPSQGVRLIPSDLTHRPLIEDFAADHDGGVVTLRWHSRASNSEEFVVERSRDGRQFETVDRIHASSRSGDYESRDAGAGEGVVYYRLRQTFPDGADRVSAMIKVGMGEERPEQVTLVGNFPNPFNNSTTISYLVREPMHVGLSVWDVSGQAVRRVVDRSQGPGYYEVQFDADDLPSGTYFVRLHSLAGSQSHKMILMK